MRDQCRSVACSCKWAGGTVPSGKGDGGGTLQEKREGATPTPPQHPLAFYLSERVRLYYDNPQEQGWLLERSPVVLTDCTITCSNNIADFPKMCYVPCMTHRGGCRILARGGSDMNNWWGGGARAKRAKNFVVRIPIFPQIVHVRGPGIGN